MLQLPQRARLLLRMTALVLSVLAMPRALETRHPVWLISLGENSDAAERSRAMLREVSALFRVPGVRAGDVAAHVHGMAPDAALTTEHEAGRRGFGRIAALVSHLAAMHAIAKHYDARISLSHDPIAIVVQDDASLEFSQWWGRVGMRLDHFIDAAPADFQFVQLAPVADNAVWHQLDRTPIAADPTRVLARWASTAPAGLGCYAVRASTAQYLTRTFWRRHGEIGAPRWDILPFLADAQRRVDLANVYPEAFLFGRAVGYVALTAPVSYHLDGSWFARGRTRDDEHAEVCARAMLAARWRMWAATQVRGCNARS